MANARCETCGNEYDESIEVVVAGQPHTFDSLECAIEALAPRCAHCNVKVIDHSGFGPGLPHYCYAHLPPGGDQLISDHARAH